MIASPHVRRIAAAALALASSAYAGAGAAQAGGHSHGHTHAPAPAPGDTARWTAADVRFMQEMIGHHAQAIQMSRLAPTRAETPSVRTLAERIIVSQRDEIANMQTWLRDRGQTVPEPAEDGTMHHAHGGGAHGGGEHGATMRGMLTPEQMAQLAAASGAEFDRLFLTYMIQHHRGAVSMVEELFGSYGAGQDEAVFKLASDVNVDQITEIARMRRMLADLIFGPQQ